MGKGILWTWQIAKQEQYKQVFPLKIGVLLSSFECKLAL